MVRTVSKLYLFYLFWVLAGSIGLAVTNRVEIIRITVEPATNNFLLIRLSLTNTVSGAGYIVERTAPSVNEPRDFGSIIAFTASDTGTNVEFFQLNNASARYYRIRNQ